MKKIIIISMFLFAVSLYCQNDTKTDVKNDNIKTNQEIDPYLKLKELDSNLKTLKAKFKQEIFFKLADMKQNIEGEIFFIKPDKLKIVHTKPNPQIIIIDSRKNIEIIKPADKQIIRSKWDKWKNNLEPRLKGLFDFGNYSSLEKHSKVTSKKLEDGYIIEIKPKNSSYTLTLKLNLDFFPVESTLDLKDTIIKTFIDSFEKNIEINSNVFEFKDKEYEIIDL